MPENTPGKTRRPQLQILAGILWLVSGVMGLYAIYSLYELSSTLYALIGDKYYVGVLIGQITTAIGGIAWIVSFISLGEYQRKHAGESSVLKFTAWVLGVETVLILLGLIFG